MIFLLLNKESKKKNKELLFQDYLFMQIIILKKKNKNFSFAILNIFKCVEKLRICSPIRLLKGQRSITTFMNIVDPIDLKIIRYNESRSKDLKPNK